MAKGHRQRLMHAKSLGAEDDLVPIHEPFCACQEFSHLDGPRLAILLALPTEPRAREPPSGLGKIRHKRADLVGMQPSRDTQQIRAVLRACARGPGAGRAA